MAQTKRNSSALTLLDAIVQKDAFRQIISKLFGVGELVYFSLTSNTVQMLVLAFTHFGNISHIEEKRGMGDNLLNT